MYENCGNEKIRREFLRNHINETISMFGEFKSFGHNGSLLVLSCSYHEEQVNGLIGVGHMWFQNIINKESYLNIRDGSVIYVTGIVTEYPNSDETYSFDTTLGLDKCSITSVCEKPSWCN